MKEDQAWWGHAADGNIKWYNHTGKRTGASSNAEQSTPHDPVILLQAIASRHVHKKASLESSCQHYCSQQNPRNGPHAPEEYWMKSHNSTLKSTENEQSTTNYKQEG